MEVILTGTGDFQVSQAQAQDDLINLSYQGPYPSDIKCEFHVVNHQKKKKKNDPNTRMESQNIYAKRKYTIIRQPIFISVLE